MLKVGHTVIHLYDNPEDPYGEGRILVTRRGDSLILVQWDSGSRSKHMAGALKRIIRTEKANEINHIGAYNKAPL
jgi:hypothetical protein